MTSSLSLVLQATFITDSGFGSDSCVFRTVAEETSQTRYTESLPPNGSMVFTIGADYELTQFILAGPVSGLLLDVQVLRPLAGTPEILALKVGGLVCLNDMDTQSITVTNTTAVDARINVLLARKRKQ